MKELINVTGVIKYFGSLKVLNSIDLSLYSSEILSILGPSGSGKTTLLRCISGLDINYKGNITIANKRQKEYLKKNRIAFVPQKYSNYPWLTVKENIQLGFKFSNVLEKKYEMETKELIKNMELEGFDNFFPNQLSGGMQQRVAIGRTLAQDTSILAMDEPFGALDYQTRESLQKLIKKLNYKFNKTIIFVTHDIEEAIYISDRIIVLSKLPSTIINEYIIPNKIKLSTDKNIKFTNEFINLRKLIEMNLKII